MTVNKSRTAKKITAVLLAAAMILGSVAFVSPAAEAGSVVIGQATSNEKGGMRGGKAGDQTKDEVALGSWSYSSKKGAYNNWKYLFRAKDPKVAKKMAEAMKAACANDKIGYDASAPDRFSLYDEAAKVSRDLAAVKKKCETTCGQLVGTCIYAAGIPTPRYYDASVIHDDLVKSGQFYKFTDKKHLKKSDLLEPGDVLVSPGVHTVMVVESPNYAGKEAKNGDISDAVKSLIPDDTGSEGPAFTAGKEYQLVYDMNVRKSATTAAKIVKYSSLSDEAKQYSLSIDNTVFAKGTVVTCISTSGNWIKVPSGWICGRQGSNEYIVEYTGSEDQVQLAGEALASAKSSRDKAAAQLEAEKAKEKAKSKSSKTITIKKGKNYKLAKNQSVRKGPGKKYAVKKRSQLTKDAKKHTVSSSKAVLKKGTVVTCLQVKGNWMKIPSGWVCCKKGYITK